MQKKTRVIVTIKKDVLDPAGTAVKKALALQGLNDVCDVRIGKVVDVVFKDNVDFEKNLSSLKHAATHLLSNPIMEDFHIEVSRDDE